MDRVVFGKYVEEKRKALGMTQKELADKLFVTNKAVSKWENGGSYPDITLFEPLAKCLGVPLEQLLVCGEEKTPDAPEKTLIEIAGETIKRNKRRLAITAAALAIVLLCVVGYIAGRAAKNDFPYVYMNGWYYEVTGETLPDESLLGEKLGEVTRSGVRRSKNNAGGDSNTAALGAGIYAITEPEGDPWTYNAAVAVETERGYAVARAVFFSRQDAEKFFGINIG